MGESDDDLNRRITQLEKRLHQANNRSFVLVLLVLVSIGLSLMWRFKPFREIRVTDGSSTAELTPTELRITGPLGTGRLNTVLIEVEEPGGKPVAVVGVGPRREGYLSLLDGGQESLTAAELLRIRQSLPNAGLSDRK